MTDDADSAAGTAHELAQLYRDAVTELNRHWPDEDGLCLGCRERYPCPEEWITMRAITGIEARWRREAKRLDVAASSVTPDRRSDEPLREP